MQPTLTNRLFLDVSTDHKIPEGYQQWYPFFVLHPRILLIEILANTLSGAIDAER